MVCCETTTVCVNPLVTTGYRIMSCIIYSHSVDRYRNKKIRVDVKIDNTVHEINKNIFLRSQEVKLV
jgi:hypothetical protein